MTTYKPQPVYDMNEKSNMRIIALLLGLCLAGSSLFVAGCSKSKSSNSSASNSNGGSAPGATALKIKWQTGKQFDMQMNLNQASDIAVPNQPIHQELKLSQSLQYSPLKELDNGGHEVKLEFQSQNMNFTQNGQQLVSYDSSDNTADETNRTTKAVAAVVQAMLGTPLVYTIAADGTVEKIDGIDDMMRRITTAMPDQQQRMQLQQMFDEDTLKRYGELARGLPDHPVSPGDTWTSSQDINNQTGVMTVDTSYTFKGMEQHNGHNCAHLLITGDIKTKTASAAQTGVMVTVKKGTINGDSWFDPELGMFVDINSDQDLTMNIQTRTMTLTDRMKQNVNLSLVDVNH
jgi:Family of unknown function (DUF6263)